MKFQILKSYKFALCGIAAIAILCPKQASADELERYWKSYRWSSLDLNYHIRQADRLSEIIDRENRQRRLDRFLRNQGY